MTLFYSIDDVMGPDGSPTLENLKSFYNKMRQGALTKTQQASIEDTEKLFRTILSKGVDLLHIAFSSGLSGTANAARLAAETLKEEFPDRKIMVVDSLCASMGQGLLVDSAIRMKEAGKSIEEVAQWLEENIPHLCHLFTVEDLKYLQRGGRISKTTALVGTMIGINRCCTWMTRANWFRWQRYAAESSRFRHWWTAWNSRLAATATASSASSSATETVRKMPAMWQSWSNNALAMRTL